MTEKKKTETETETAVVTLKFQEALSIALIDPTETPAAKERREDRERIRGGRMVAHKGPSASDLAKAFEAARFFGLDADTAIKGAQDRARSKTRDRIRDRSDRILTNRACHAAVAGRLTIDGIDAADAAAAVLIADPTIGDVDFADEATGQEAGQEAGQATGQAPVKG